MGPRILSASDGGPAEPPPERPGFDTPGLAARLRHASAEALDGLDFAVIRVDGDGIVRALNRRAADLPGFRGEGAVGRSFYGEVAPDLANADLRARIERALERGALDLELGHAGSLADRLHGLRGRMQPADGGGFWLFLAPLWPEAGRSP